MARQFNTERRHDEAEDLTDTTSKSGASIIAASITSYWRGRGYPSIKAWIEPTSFEDPSLYPEQTYTIKSNIGPNGFPPRG